MGYRNLSQCVRDLESRRDLVRIDIELDPDQEIGLIQRRVYQAGGPALLFTNVKGCNFPLLANLFGTQKRIHFLFRDTISTISRLLELKTQGLNEALKSPCNSAVTLFSLKNLIPKRVNSGPVLRNNISITDLPHIRSWPMDGGAFITLPIVYSESPVRPGINNSNMGMYRVQLSGNKYKPDRQVGMHYQIHRGIGVHHAEAINHSLPLKVNIIVGGPPALTLAAVMPLPHGMSELLFACLLAGHRIPMISLPDALPVPAEADFCISGTISPTETLPEGPFGDHLGYYSLVHNFPVVDVDSVHCRDKAIWPFTTVGRPPQEDTEFGKFIHEITGPVVPDLVPGIKSVHAVDEAGVHPLLLAIGSERYVPYEIRRPREILTQAYALLGQGQLSLAKYLFICAYEDKPDLDINDIRGFFIHILERVDWMRDLHFFTRTNTDTLDYSGGALNSGSKLVIAAAGQARRELPVAIPPDLVMPEGFSKPMPCLPGVLCVNAPLCNKYSACEDVDIQRFCNFFDSSSPICQFPLIVLVDDSEFTSRSTANFLWITFTRSDPARDVYGIMPVEDCRHWGCRGPVVIDARMKPHLPPILEEDPALVKKIEGLAAPNRPLHGLF